MGNNGLVQRSATFKVTKEGVARLQTGVARAEPEWVRPLADALPHRDAGFVAEFAGHEMPLDAQFAAFVTREDPYAQSVRDVAGGAGPFALAGRLAEVKGPKDHVRRNGGSPPEWS